MGNEKLSRIQRRDKERREEEARSVYESLARKFFDYFMSADNPESEQTEDKRLELNSKWLMYCRRSNLLPVAYGMFNDYAKGVIKEYKETKENGGVVEHALSQSPAE